MLTALKQGVCYLTFTKVSTRKPRVMKATLLPVVVGYDGAEKNANKDKPTLSVWDVEKNAWRSFRIDSVSDFVSRKF
jgi:hypothetical protein